MNPTTIFWPMLAQLAIPFWVLILNALRKLRDRRSGAVGSDAPINNKDWSLPVVLTSNSLENQFQFPVVFYALCLMLVNLNSVTPIILMLSWLFVLTRWWHAYVHVTSNAIPLRMISFAISMLSVLLLFFCALGALISYET